MPAPRTTGTGSRGSVPRPVVRRHAPRGAAPEAALREAVLREAVLREAARRAAAGRPPLTPQEAAALRAALAIRAGSSPGSRSGGSATGRGTAARRGRPAPGRRSGARRRRPHRGPAPSAPGRWRTRLALGALGLVLPVLGLLVPGGQGTGIAAEPPGEPDLALAAQATMHASAGRYRALERELAELRADLRAAQDAERAAQERAAAARAAVGAGAAALYRAPAGVRVPLLDLDVTAPGRTADVLRRQALADRADRALTGAATRAARAGQETGAARAAVAAAQAAVDRAEARAADLLGEVRLHAVELGPDVAARIAGLGGAPAAGEQQDRNDQALRRWQDSLAVLAAAGITSPPAAALADPAHLPAGMSPALDGAGRPVPGIAWAVAGNRPVTVLPAETVAAVSAALTQLGKPYAPGASGPDAYDCGGFTSASWLQAGYALPPAAADQWAGGAAVPLEQLQVGDLVFADGGADVALYLGEGQVVRASGASYQVGVAPLAEVTGAVRVTLGGPGAPNAALPAGTTGRGPCGTPPAPVGPVSPAWGGWSNGAIPSSALCPVGAGHALRCDAATAYRALAGAFAEAFGRPLCITDSYRSLSAQKVAFGLKPRLAAVPGTSNHGWALAVDLCGGINVAGSPESAWMAANAGRFGWVNPDWARPGGAKPEPWHWEFGHLA